MPGSSEKGKDQIVKWFNAVGKKRFILDIGPGRGTYSRMLREKRQVWHAVEIFPKYIDQFKLNNYYDKIFISDVKKFIPKQKYDIVICGDVSEHIDNESATKVLNNLLKNTSYLIVSLPLDKETHAPQGTGDVDWGNPRELHSGSWSNELFIKTIFKLGREVVAMEKYPELAVYLVRGSVPRDSLDFHLKPSLCGRLKNRRIFSIVNHNSDPFWRRAKHMVMTVLARAKARLLKTKK